jgi:hypothetical protein
VINWPRHGLGSWEETVPGCRASMPRLSSSPNLGIDALQPAGTISSCLSPIYAGAYCMIPRAPLENWTGCA